VPTSTRAALRARQRDRITVLHPHFNIAALEAKINPRHPPRALDSKDPTVKLRVAHPKSLSPAHSDSRSARNSHGCGPPCGRRVYLHSRAVQAELFPGVTSRAAGP